MSLSLKTTKVNLEDDLNYVITEEDIILARETGLLNEEDESEKMLENIDDFYNEQDKFIEELEISENPSWFAIEGIFTKNYTYKDVPVRIISIKDNFGFGSIYGNDEVYIPKSLISKVSLHQLVSMDLVYLKKDTNCWKAIKVNNLKDDLVTISELIVDDNNEGVRSIQNVYHIPFQDIGFIIGKNGHYIKKIIKNYIINNPEDALYFNPDKLDAYNFDEWYENANVPSIDVNNYSTDYTEIKLYYNIKIEHIDKIKFDPLNDFIKKLYY